MDVTTRKLLEDHRSIWRSKPLLRFVYAQWYRSIERMLAGRSAPVVELGSGGGNYKEWRGSVIAGDIVATPWLDFIADAHTLPFKNDSQSDIVAIDLLHHLSRPLAFIREAQRTLRPGGRLHLVEPYPSPLSLPLYRRFHPEPFAFERPNFEKQEDPWKKVPNQAAAYLLFFRYRTLFDRHFGGSLRIIKRTRFATLLYPLSGGFEGRQLIPYWMKGIARIAEAFLWPLTPLLAFRCYVVCEKIG
jgi:SAM-dependent methyltransferase